MKSFYILLFLIIFELTITGGKPLDCVEVCKNKSMRNWLKLCACEATAGLSGTRKYENLERSDIFYEPADTPVAEPPSFFRPDFSIVNPTKLVKSKVDQSEELEDYNAGQQTAKKPRNILQENSFNQRPIYSYLDVGLKENTITKNNKQQDIEKLEKKLMDCLDLHILVITRNNQTHLESVQRTEYKSIPDSDILKELQNKCSEPLQLIENSIDEVKVKLPKKKNTKLTNYYLNTEHDNAEIASNVDNNNNNYEKEAQEVMLKEDTDAGSNLYNRLNSSDSVKEDDENIINDFLPVVVQESFDLDKFISTEQNLQNKNHIVISENTVLKQRTNERSSNLNNISVNEQSKNNNLQEVNEDQTESNSSFILEFQPIFSNPDVIIDDDETNGEEYAISLPDTKNHNKDQRYKINGALSQNKEDSNTQVPVRKEILNSFEPSNIFEKINNTPIEEEQDISDRQGYQNMQSNNHEIYDWPLDVTTTDMVDEEVIASPDLTTNESTTLIQQSPPSVGDSKTNETAEHLANSVNLKHKNDSNILSGTTSANQENMSTQSYIEPFHTFDDNLKLGYDVLSKESSTNAVQDGTIITRHQVDEKDFKIPKIQTKEIENGTVISSVIGIEKLPNNDFIGENMRATPEETVSGKLYFIYNDHKVPARFTQDQTGKIRLGLDGTSICHALFSQNTTSFTSPFLYKLCSHN